MAASTRTGRWTRRYPPLLALAAALLVAVFVLPSSLNLQQANPTETEQFAPVPPSTHSQATSVGNLSSLSLGTSGTLSGDGAGGTGGGGGQTPTTSLLPGVPPIPNGAGLIPDQYPCVGEPPRQTADPLSPPCVAYYNGNNGGATYPGATAGYVTIIAYIDAGLDTATDDGVDNESSLDGECFDLRQPLPTNAKSPHLRNYGRWQRYFNYHFATYKRLVYFEYCFSSGATAQDREADAAQEYRAYHPFAVMDDGADLGDVAQYADYMADRGVLVFGSQGMQPRSFYEQYPARIWSYLPTVELQAEAFSNYVCEKVVGQPVVDSGDPAWQGKPRVLGFLSSSDPTFPALIEYASLIKQETEACGAHYVVSGTFPHADDTLQVENADAAATYAEENMARFKAAGVTTIIWAGGYETNQSGDASTLDYTPEWILAGDGFNEGTYDDTYQNQAEWAHAWDVTNITYFGSTTNQLCYQAIEQADPTIGDDANWACQFDFEYEDLRELFTGIQVAGPDLTPASIDQGFHAIPAVPSIDPRVPACYYEVNDYTCVKDSIVEHWNPKLYAPIAPEDMAGCWQMVQNGKRYLDGDMWPSGNITAQYSPSDMCNAFSISAPLY